MLKDEILLDLARTPIDAPAAFARMRGLPRPVEAKYGSQIIAATQRASQLPSECLPARQSYEPDPQDKFRADSLFYAMQCLCAARQIDPTLVASRQEIGTLYHLLADGKDPSAQRIMLGWRRQAIGEKLLDLFAGRASFSFAWKDGAMRSDVPR